MRITAFNDTGIEFEAYKSNARAKPAAGPLFGFKCHPSGPGHNLIENAVSFDEIEDAAAYLRANRAWGIRLKPKTGPANIFYENILIDGKPR